MPTLLGIKSPGAVLRDAAAECIAALGILKTLRVVPTFQWQPEDMTACGVYFLRETSVADGDFNAGEPHFSCDATIGVNVLVRVDDPAQLADATDIYVDPILGALLTNPDFLALCEGIPSISRTPTYPPNASAYMSETRLEFAVVYQRRWEPVVPDDYRKTVLKTRQLGADPNSPALTTVIDLAQS